MKSLWDETNINIIVLVFAGSNASHHSLLANKIDKYQRDPLLEKKSSTRPCLHPLEHRLMLTRTGSEPGGHFDTFAVYRYEHNLQAAMDIATGMVKDSLTRYELAADALLKENAADRLVKAHLAKFIDSCRYA